ncbi:cytochrome c oxidase assembly protein [Rhodococcus sp. 27YEA15]|uniref:cytochrome c oxidase assembly protein n=1 Tax=Rhodococcus sp. 27YEA15 TaxID=3156259 RepID=UPI003C7E90B4
MLDPTGREKFDAVTGGRSARVRTFPATTSVVMLAAPWLPHLTGWYIAVLERNIVDQLSRLLPVLVGFGSFYSRSQADPLPRKYSQHCYRVLRSARAVVGSGSAHRSDDRRRNAVGAR